MQRILAAFSWELLFWLPTVLDLFLLIGTYSACTFSGVSWYLQSQKEVISAQKKKYDADGSSSSENVVELSPEVHAVWELAMAAYSAYACLLPLAVYWCIIRPDMRPSFCWTMTGLMIYKTYILSKSSSDKTICESKRREGLNSLLFFYFPTYGGYAIVKTFLGFPAV